MPPAARQVVVAGAEPATFRARPLFGRAGYMDADLALSQVFEIELDLGDSPRGFEAEDSLIKVFVSHTRDNMGRFPASSRTGVAAKPPQFPSERRCSPRRYSTAQPRP